MIDETKLIRRCADAVDTLSDLADQQAPNGFAHTRLVGKIAGVRLAVSYIEEIVRAQTAARSHRVTNFQVQDPYA